MPKIDPANAAMLLIAPYGASTIAHGDGSRLPSENELAGARYQGRHVAQITVKLAVA